MFCIKLIIKNVFVAADLKKCQLRNQIFKYYQLQQFILMFTILLFTIILNLFIFAIKYIP